MSPIAHWTVLVLTGVAYVGAALLVVLVYRRTKNVGFLWLLGALFAWPLIESASLELLRHFLREALAGRAPWLFPYSLIAVSPGWTGWQMPPGEFVTKTYAMHSIIRNGLLLAATFFLARGFGALPFVKSSDAPVSQSTAEAS